ncbi:MAG: alpha/beta fold hydrolase [Blastocatellia bacterium]
MKTSTFRLTVGAPEPRKFVSLGELEIAYIDSEGNGPILVCLHAIGHGAGDFGDLSRRLGSEYRLIGVDFPGHGNSGSDSKAACGIRYTEILTQFIDRLELDSVILLGNSIGGATAIRYAAANPGRVKALVLSNTGGLDPGGAVARIFTKTFALFFAAGRRHAFWFPWAFSRYYHKVLTGEPAREQRERIIRSAYEIAPILEQAWKSFSRPEEDLRDLLPSIQCPVLIAWAKDDFINQLKRSGLAFARLPNHCIEVFEGGHAAFLEDPDHFDHTLRAFLDDID